MTTLKTSNEEMNDIMKLVKFLKDSRLLMKDVSESTENELGTLGPSLLENL